MQGVYSITCNETGSVYIGRSSNIETRWREHRRSLAAGKHHNAQLQADYNTHGVDSLVHRVEKQTDNITDAMREESALYYTLKEQGVNVHNKAGIIDYRVITKEESLVLGEAIINRCENALIERNIKQYEWSVESLAEQLERNADEVLIAVREYLNTDCDESTYRVTLTSDYTTYCLVFIDNQSINEKMKNFTIGI